MYHPVEVSLTMVSTATAIRVPADVPYSVLVAQRLRMTCALQELPHAVLNVIIRQFRENVVHIPSRALKTRFCGTLSVMTRAPLSH